MTYGPLLVRRRVRGSRAQNVAFMADLSHDDVVGGDALPVLMVAEARHQEHRAVHDHEQEQDFDRSAHFALPQL